ncbi:FANCI [Lepeophtheirus salmonis]|uniref:FANCI n=1 Tax=Lepeophtheirus salmonis TaxID=72036 RepID=A0A7R8D6E3_LEPSM|nr:FANCI [Lepeophtheirus salmonis]CAF3043437.1 FANCI [Lepeophtheirus salmonis]
MKRCSDTLNVNVEEKKRVQVLEELLEIGAKIKGFKDLKISLLESLLSRVFFNDAPSLVVDKITDPEQDLKEGCVNIVAKLLFLIGERIENLTHKTKFISSLASHSWKPSNAIIFTSIFRSTSLKTSELHLILDKITSLISSLSPEQIPPLVHQILHLTQSSDATSDLQYTSIYHSRDTVILHILQSIKIGHSISQHLLKLLRILDYRCLHDPFVLFTCLSITSVKHIRKQVIEGLKTLVVKHIEFQVKAFNTGWLIELSEKYPESFEKIILNLISTSIRFGGWSFIQNGCIELTFNFLDVSNSKNEVHLPRVWNTATEILRKILNDSPDSAEIVIKELSSRVITSQTFPQYTVALRKCIRKNLNVFLQNTSILTSLLDQVPLMSVYSAKNIISAFQPLLKRSRLLRDQLIMIFRKALFSSNVDSRQIAILGVLELIKCFKLNISSEASLSVLSQSSGSLMTQSVVDIHAGVQLTTIRATIYKELCQSVVNNIRSSVDIGKLIENDRIYEPVEETDLQIESGQSVLHAEIMQNIYESLMNFVSQVEIYPISNVSMIYSLFKKYKSIDVPAEEPPSKTKKTGKEGPKPNRCHTLALSSRAIVALLEISLSSDSSQDLNDGHFILWILNLARTKILELEQYLKTAGAQENDATYNELLVFGSSLIVHSMKSASLKNGYVHLLCECLYQIFQLVNKHYFDSLENFVVKIENQTNNFLEKLDEDDTVPSIVVNHLKIIWFLADISPGDNRIELKFINDWLKHMVKGSVCPIFLQKVAFDLLIALELKIKSAPGILVELAREIHLKVGDTKGKSVDVSGKYAAVTKDSGEEVCVILVNNLGYALDTAELLLHNLQQISNWNTHEKRDMEAALNFEASLCQFLAHLSNASSELSQTAFPNCSAVHDPIFKLFTRLYFILGKMAKYFCTGFIGKTNSSIQSSRFDKLVMIISDRLTKNIYTLINFAEDLSQEEVQNASTRSKSRATKDSKIIPQLIFSIAEFEKNLMKLNSFSKTDLIQLCKISTARDFRFNVEALEKSE